VAGVTLSGVTAAHSNGLDPAFSHKDQADALESNGLRAYLGPAGGYILQLSNGLVANLSSDTGVIADQGLVVRRLYKALLMVLNIGSTLTAGPADAAHVANELVKPRSVIASHANEQATQDGKLHRTGSKTEAFSKAAHAPVYLPLSDHTAEFDAIGACVVGC